MAVTLNMDSVDEGLRSRSNYANTSPRGAAMFITDHFLELHKFLSLPAVTIAMAASLVVKVAQSASARPSVIPTERGPGFGTPMHFLSTSSNR